MSDDTNVEPTARELIAVLRNSGYTLKPFISGRSEITWSEPDGFGALTAVMLSDDDALFAFLGLVGDTV